MINIDQLCSELFGRDGTTCDIAGFVMPFMDRQASFVIRMWECTRGHWSQDLQGPNLRKMHAVDG